MPGPAQGLLLAQEGVAVRRAQALYIGAVVLFFCKYFRSYLDVGYANQVS